MGEDSKFDRVPVREIGIRRGSSVLGKAYKVEIWRGIVVKQILYQSVSHLYYQIDVTLRARNKVWKSGLIVRIVEISSREGTAAWFLNCYLPSCFLLLTCWEYTQGASVSMDGCEYVSR